MTRPATETTIRPGLRSTEIGCPGPGILIGFASAWTVCSIGGHLWLSRCAGLCRRLATVDEEHLTGREGRLARSEEDDCVGDLGRLARTLERNTRHEAGLSFGVAGKAVEHCGLDRPRRDGIDPHPRCRSLQRRGLGEPLDGVLACRIDRRTARPKVTIGR